MIFTPEDVVDEHELAEEVSKDYEQYDLLLQGQHQRLAMPLIDVKLKKMSRFISKFLTISKFRTPPLDSQKLFDKDVDNYNFCTVYRVSKKFL